MEIPGQGISPLFDGVAGCCVFILLIVDAMAFVSGFSLLIFLRLRVHGESARRNILKDDARDGLEIFQEGGAFDRNTLVEKLKGLPDDDKAALFLEYTRMVFGRFHDMIVAIFKEAELGEWVRKSSVSRKWWRRLRAVRMIEILEYPEAIGIIRRRMRDKSLLISMSAVQMAIQFPEKEVIADLLELLKDKYGMMNFVIKDAFIRIGTAGSEELLEFLGAAKDQKLVVWAIAVAGEIKDPVFVEPLMEFVEHSDGRIRAAAARALSSFPEERAIKVLTAALGDGDDEVRAMAANSLGRIGNEKTVGRIVDVFSDKSWMVRLNCALALKRMGGKGQRALSACKNHNDRYVADMARHMESLSCASINWSE